MELNQDSSVGQYYIRSYGKDFIQINDEKIYHSIIVSPDKLIAWSPQSLTELNATHFFPVFDLEPSIVLLGTGTQLFFPTPALLKDFYTKKIGIEIMNTAAACRTYTVLMSEKRKVAAALLIR